MTAAAAGLDVAFADHDVTLYQGECVNALSKLGHHIADAIVTSPPYLDARPDVESVADLDAYLVWAQGWLIQAAYSVVPHGSLLLNVGRLHRNGEEVPFADELRRVACTYGWRWFDTLVWHKVNGGGGRSSRYLLDRHEYVYWLVQGHTGYPYTGFDEARVPYSPATLERYERRWSTRGSVAKNVLGGASEGREAHPGGALPGSVFTCSVGAEKGLGHPTPMALDLALHLVRLSCPPGGTVLDPFAGSGTTGVAARALGRRAVLIEVDATHCAEASSRLGQQTLLA